MSFLCVLCLVLAYRDLSIKKAKLMVANLTLGWRQINRLLTAVRKFCPFGRFYLMWLLIVCVDIIPILSYLLCGNVAESKSSLVSGKKNIWVRMFQRKQRTLGWVDRMCLLLTLLNRWWMLHRQEDNRLVCPVVLFGIIFCFFSFVYGYSS